MLDCLLTRARRHSRPDRSRPDRSRPQVYALAPEFLVVTAVLALIWLGITVTLLDQLHTASTTAARDTGNLSRAFEENTARVIAGFDQLMLAMRADYEDGKPHFDLAKWMRTKATPDRFTAQIGLSDATGLMLMSTGAFTRVSIADRYHFKVQQQAKDDQLYISQPVLGRVSGRWSIQLVRKLMTRDGAFDGVIVASIDCIDLSKFYQSLDLQDGFIALGGTDGVVRARSPMVEHALGSAMFPPDLLKLVLEEHHGLLKLTNTLGERHSIVSYRELQSYPLIVAVGFGYRQVFQRYRDLRFNLLVVGAAASLVVLMTGGVWISQRKRALKSRRALSLTLENIDQGIVMIDADGTVPVVNKRALELLRLPERASLRRRWREQGNPVAAALGRGLLLQPDHRQIVTYDDGTVIEGCRQRLADGGIVQTITDVTARRRAEERIYHMAHHDHLTGLGNRILFAERIGHEIARWHREQVPFAVLCLDLNGFKKINDTLGHDVGDELLRAVAGRLRNAAGESDFVARVGGDEFLILSRGADQPRAAAALAAAVTDSMRGPFAIGSQSIQVGVCIGMVVCPDHGTERSALLKNADLALYCAKIARDKPVRLFEPQMATTLREREALERDLRAAILEHRLEVVFQPQLEIATMEIVGFEALVRWHDPVRGAVGPDVFIRLAEETGLIMPLGRFVLEQACRAAAGWPAPVRVAVNISPVQFRDAALPGMVESILAETGLSPYQLELEVTEGVLILDETQGIETLRSLQALGVRVALDDFGTGYASMRYLQRFSFDRIKLDKSFVQAQVLEPKAKAILESVLILSRRLRIGVVAEGVETVEQLDLLRNQGCGEVQGFLTGRPIRDTAVFELLRKQATPGLRDFLAPIGKRRTATPLFESSATPPR